MENKRILIGDLKSANCAWMVFELLRDRILKDQYHLTADISFIGLDLVKLAQANDYHLFFFMLNNIDPLGPYLDRLQGCLEFTALMRFGRKKPVIGMSGWLQDDYGKRAESVCDYFFPWPARLDHIANAFRQCLEDKP